MIGAALARLGYHAIRLPMTLDLARARRELSEAHPALVFNLVESLAGDDRLCPLAAALFDHLRLPYTGAPQHALSVAVDKVRSKRLLARAGIRTPHWLTAAAELPREGNASWIVKRRFSEASIGLDDASVVTQSELPARLAERDAHAPGAWFAEEFVDGREFNIALIATPSGPRVLSIAEIRFDDFPEGKPRIVGYAAKWDAGSFEYHHTPRSFAANAAEPLLAAQLAEIARRCWDLFDLDGYARVDIRLAGDTPSVLEINANPCLSPDAGFAAALNASGIGYDDGIELIVNAALK